jgi:hypothetical protein
MTQAPEKRFELRDGMQPVTFAGEQLAFASSQPDGDTLPDRWTELAVYKTVTNKYVLEKIGRSNLFHVEGCTVPGKGALRYESVFDALEDVDESASPDDLEQFFVPCTTCNPSFDSEDPVIVEQDFHQVNRYEDPEQLLEALYHRKGSAVRQLSSLSRTLLDLAARKDEGIRLIRNRPTDIS